MCRCKEESRKRIAWKKERRKETEKDVIQCSRQEEERTLWGISLCVCVCVSLSPAAHGCDLRRMFEV